MRAQHRIKRQEDTFRRELEFQVGELVYPKLQPYRQQSLSKRGCAKLAARFYGPFPVVLQRIGAVAYKLQLPSTSKIHPVFHVSQLKKAVGSSSATPTLPANINEALVWEGVPEEVLGVRQSKSSSAPDIEVLIQWRGLPDYEATWEQFENVDQMFPSFHLEDKVAVWAVGNAMNSNTSRFRFTYARRAKGKQAHEDQAQGEKSPNKDSPVGSNGTIS